MAPPTTVHDVPDHLLHRIFRLLGSHDAVVRTAAVCKRWRPIAASHRRSTFRFVHNGRWEHPSRLRIVSVVGDELRVFAKQHVHNGGDGTSDWLHERSLRLPEATSGLPGRKECYFSRAAKIVTAGRGYVVLTPAEGTWLFSVDLRTMQVEREHSRNWLAGEVYPYELETEPKVHACLVRCKRQRQGPCREFCKCN